MRIVRKNRNFSKKNFSDKEEIWDFIVDNGIATDDEVRLVIDINGYSEGSLNDIIYARTGFHSVEQYKESEGMEDFACGGKKKFAEGYDAEWKEPENEKHARLIAELKEKAQKKLDNGLDEMKVRLWLKEAIKQENNRHSNAYEERYGH